MDSKPDPGKIGLFRKFLLYLTGKCDKLNQIGMILILEAPMRFHFPP